MEEDKSKRNKRNKKKKNKQASKPTESVSLDAPESISNSQNHMVERVEDNNGLVSGTTEQQAEKDAQTQIQDLEEKTKQLLRENEKNSQKEAFLNEKLLQLRKEKHALILKEGNLELKIQQLLLEVDAHSQKEASLAAKILILEAEKESWLKKEAVYEGKIIQLVEEAEVLNFKVVSLQEMTKEMEKERDSWIPNENSAKESIANLTNDNAQLQAQVIELEHARETLLEEKKQLEELNSSQKLLTKNLGSTDVLSHSPMDNKPSEEDMNYQIESPRAIADKLIAENSELIEKMNGLYAELDRRDKLRTEDVSSAHTVHRAPHISSGDESALTPDMAVRTVQATDSVSEISQQSSMPDIGQPLEDMMVEDRRNGVEVNVNDGYRIGSISEIMEADDEIVQIPLDEQEIGDINLTRAQNEEKTDVPLTDAPLIGAPFRFISFVSRYVSGADLVK